MAEGFAIKKLTTEKISLFKKMQLSISVHRIGNFSIGACALVPSQIQSTMLRFLVVGIIIGVIYTEWRGGCTVVYFPNSACFGAFIFHELTPFFFPINFCSFFSLLFSNSFFWIFGVVFLRLRDFVQGELMCLVWERSSFGFEKIWFC